MIFDIKESPWLRTNQKIIIEDLLNTDAVNRAVKGANVVYNFAGISDLNHAYEEPFKTMEINVLGQTKLLEACRKYDVEKFIYASTVYVNSKEGSFYRISKQTSEQLLLEYQKRYGIDFTILRYGSIYGPRSDSTNGLYRIIYNAIKEGKLKYSGNPDSIREYIHVDDVAKASVSALGEDFKNQRIVLTGRKYKSL